jgi:DNA transposition AAA+ family ATPase
MEQEYPSISLEQAQIEAIAETYPEIKEDFIWLAGYLRERCSRKFEVLEHRIREHGFKTDRTTLSRMFRGLWNKDSKGAATKHPLMSVLNFQQIVDTLRKEARREDLAGKVPFVETGTWEDIKLYIEIKRAPEQVCKFGLIIGPTGSQKSACVKHYRDLNNSGKVVHLEAPEKPTMTRFMRELGTAYGISQKYTCEPLRLRILENVKAAKCIIIDNIQRLYKERQGWNQEIFNFLQKLQDDTGCTIILVAVPEFEAILRNGRDRGYFEQFEGRVGGVSEFLTLPEYTPREDIKQIAESFGLKDRNKEVVEYLEKITRERGRIRILFNALQKAKRLADKDGEKLAIGHVRRARNEEAA